MKKSIIFLLITACAAFSLTGQAATAISFNTEVTGEVTDENPENVWQFSGLRDQMVSIVVDGEGDFDPIVTLRLSGGVDVITNDDIAYPDTRDAILDGISLPRQSQYDIVVTGYGGSTGEYSLMLLPGYADLAISDGASDLDDWKVDETLTTSIVDSGIEANVTGVQVVANLLYDSQELGRSYYVEAGLEIVTGRDGWAVGIVVNRQSNGDHYLYSVNHLGSWRITAVEGDAERVLRDWSPHPAIVAGEGVFTPAVLYNEGVIELFYNNQLLGRFYDMALAVGGRVGVKIVTANSLQGEVSAILTDFTVTAPRMQDGEYVFAGSIVDGTASQTIQELERRHLMPSGGRLLFEVSESFIDNRNPGVDLLTLGQGITAESFAFGTTLTIEPEVSVEGTVGCGLLMSYRDETDHIVAFVDNVGGYGVSRRNGEGYGDGLFDTNPNWVERRRHNLVTVVNNGTINFWVNGLYVGGLQVEVTPGEVGNAALNFDPINITCQFTNTWLWSWEN